MHKQLAYPQNGMVKVKSSKLALPSLLDRLESHTDNNGQRVMRTGFSREQLKQAVIRDLTHLLNSQTHWPASIQEQFPQLVHSVLGHGIPPLAGQLSANLPIYKLEALIRRLIVAFEPRLNPATLEVQAEQAVEMLNQHNVIGFRIHAELWANPQPVAMVLRTELDLETGHVALGSLYG